VWFLIDQIYDSMASASEKLPASGIFGILGAIADNFERE